MAEAGGATEAQIRRAGRWNAEKMEGCYLTTLPKKAIRALAGFNAGGGGFYLRRDMLMPPAALVNKVFEQAERWEAAFLPKDIEQDIAGQGFLRLLKELRVVLLQDAVVMRDDHFPNHCLWGHPLFACSEFETFSAEVRGEMEHGTDPALASVRSVIPVLTNVVETGFMNLSDRIEHVEISVTTVKDQFLSFLKNGMRLVVASDDHEAPKQPIAASCY